MSTAYHACTCHLILLILIYCFYSSEVTAQCVMEDRVGFQGIDTLGNVITSASGSDFQVCKDYCLATDACLAVEFRGGVACTAWTEDPQLSVEAGNTISVKVCTPDGVDTSFTTILQTSSEQQMALPATNLDMPSTNDFPSSTEPVFDSTSSSSYKLLPSETTTNAVIPQQTPSHTLATSTDYDDLTVGTMVLQTPEESQQIRTTMTSEIPTASDLITSSDHISPTESVTVSATPIPKTCTMAEMADTDVSNSAAEYKLETDEDCITLCQNTHQCQHVIYINDIRTCKLYVGSSITSFYQTNHTLFSKQTCANGQSCCFDIDVNASSSDEPALTLSPTSDACKEFCLAFDFCKASIYDGEKCKVISTSSRPFARENVVLFMKNCPRNSQSPLTRTDACSDGRTMLPNEMLTILLGGPLIGAYLVGMI